MNITYRIPSAPVPRRKVLPRHVRAVSRDPRFHDQIADLLARSAYDTEWKRDLYGIDIIDPEVASTLVIDIDHIGSLGDFVSIMMRHRRHAFTPTIIVSESFKTDDFSDTRRAICDISLMAPLTAHRLKTALPEAAMKAMRLPAWLRDVESPAAI